MISFIKTEEGHKILFQPWSNVLKKEVNGETVEVYNKIQLPELSFPLIFGHICPKCENIIQAAFLTTKLVDPKGYEELNTTIRDTHGQRKVLRTGGNYRFKSKYETIPVQRGNNVSAQLIRLEEHFRIPDDAETCICYYMAFFSFRPDMALQQVMLHSNLNPSKYNLTDEALNDIENACIGQSYAREEFYRVHDVMGSKSDLWLRKHGAYDWVINRAVSTHLKPTDDIV